MSISADGWLSWTERVPGDPRKLNGGPNGLLGIAGHSAEGWEAYLRAYNTDHAAYAGRKASWMFSNLRSGVMLQHFPVFAQCWTSGAGWPNNNLWGVESEGVAGMPLNEAQTQNMVRLINEQRALTGRLTVQRIGNRTSAPPGVLVIVEHRETTRWGAVPTSCPSGRYNWDEILFRLNAPEPEPVAVKEEEDMAVVITEPGPVNRAYLLKGSLMQWIPNQQVFDGLVSVYGPPKPVDPATFEWLIQQHRAAGYPWG